MGFEGNSIFMHNLKKKRHKKRKVQTKKEGWCLKKKKKKQLKCCILGLKLQGMLGYLDPAATSLHTREYVTLWVFAQKGVHTENKWIVCCRVW